MAKIELNNEQLMLIQKALDFYSRMGALQFKELLSHPTISNLIINNFSSKKKLEVGDETMRGIVVEIGNGYIKTKGNWGNGEEIRKWNDVDKIKISTDLSKVNEARDQVETKLNYLKKLISGQDFANGNYGIGSKEVDDSCRDAYDLIQIIRHEFWKEKSNKSNATVDSSVHLMNKKNEEVKVEIDTIKDIRKRKIKKIEK